MSKHFLKAVGGSKGHWCDGLTRREWLRAGALSMLGLTLPDLLQRRALAAAAPRGLSFGRAKSCIVVFLFGAPAHQDIWDLKPEAPREMRREVKPIARSVPGIFVGEHIPRIATQAQHQARVRSGSHQFDPHRVDHTN